ncbi:hypothetical protein ACFXPR_15605 [Nocardia tengchongensis]|uniref:hypothetical protein n=1 Tax=Nocardia tengchongensis TaxID=2055889 RepID=UPI003676D8E5
MSYPGGSEVRVVSLGRAIDAMRSGGYEISEDSLRDSGVINQVTRITDDAILYSDLNRNFPQIFIDLVYEYTYLAAIARWQLEVQEEFVDVALVNRIIDLIKEILNGLLP